MQAMKLTNKQLRLEAEKQARSEALNRFIRQQRHDKQDLEAKQSASYFAFGITLLILGAAVYGIVKTGGL